MKVLFVCTGNTCRSPMAEGILKDIVEKKALDIDVESAGIFVYEGGSPAENSIEVMKEIDIVISNHSSTQLDEKLLKESDLILTMSTGHKFGILSDYPSYEGRVFNLLEYAYGNDEDVEDPYGRNIKIYKETRDEIYQAVENIIKKL